MGFVNTWKDFEKYQEACREICRAILKGALQERGAMQKLAHKLGVSPEYLSAVIGCAELRKPSLNFIERLSHELPIDPELRNRFREYMLMSHYRQQESQDELAGSITDGSLQSEMQLFWAANHESIFSDDPAVLRINTALVYRLGQTLIQLSKEIPYLNLADICFYLSGKAITLRKPEDGLYFAKLGQAILKENAVYARVHYKRHESLLVNLAIAEATSYHHLRWYRESARKRESIYGMLRKIDRSIEPWKPLIYREHIPTVIKLSRPFSIIKITDMVEEAKLAIEKNHEQDPVTAKIQLERPLAEVYITNDNLNKAEKILKPYFKYIGDESPLDLIQQVMLYRTIARMKWNQNDRSLEGDWYFFAKKAITIACKAGFSHQIRGIQKDFGTTIQLLIDADSIKSYSDTMPARGWDGSTI